MSHRLLIWLPVLAVILGGGWYKSVQNRQAMERQAAWRAAFDRLQAESQVERKSLTQWIQSLHSQPDARQKAASRLNHGQPLEVRQEGHYEVAEWT